MNRSQFIYLFFILDTSAFIVVICFFFDILCEQFQCAFQVLSTEVTYKFLIYLTHAYLKITIKFMILKLGAFEYASFKVSTFLYAFALMTTACLFSPYPFSLWSLNIFTKTLTLCVVNPHWWIFRPLILEIMEGREEGEKGKREKHQCVGATSISCLPHTPQLRWGTYNPDTCL